MTMDQGKTFRGKRWAAMIALVAIAACSKEQASSQQQDSAAVAEKDLQATLAEVQLERDPWKAFQRLDARETEILKENNPCSGGTCLPVPSWNKSSAERLRLMASALSQGKKEAYEYLYSKELNEQDEYTALRRASVDKLLSFAEILPGAKGDEKLILLAADLLAGGNEVVRDTSRAVGLYARAWAMGQAQAAERAARVFLSINDLRNAYLWSLRCVGACSRTQYGSESIDLNQLQSRMSPLAVKQAQKQAADQGVVEIDSADVGSSS
jgi:hypothetical protein